MLKISRFKLFIRFEADYECQSTEQYSYISSAFQRLLTCLEQIRHKFDSPEDDYQFLCNYFHSEDFRKLLKVREYCMEKK